MKKHEVIVLLILMIISTIYSLSLPETEVKQVINDPQIKIIVEGKYNQTLTFNKAPTIEDVFKQLDIKNVYGFDDKTVLSTRTVFYIPEGEDLISLNKATKDQLMSIKGIGPKTAEKIIEHRQKTPFCTIEDITKVSGIGQKRYLKIRGLLCL